MKLGFSPFAFHGTIQPFHSVFKEGLSLASTPVAMCDAIVLWGGTDINPGLYYSAPHPFNGFQPGSERDRAERVWAEQAIELGIPLIGVCRGAQFLCAMAGGKLIQHCTGHGREHAVTVIEDGKEKVYQTSSSHHQMLYPFDLPADEYQILGYSTNPLSRCYDGETEHEQLVPVVEPEVVLFPKIRALAIQGHPEWMDDNDGFVIWCNKEIKKLCASIKNPSTAVVV